MSFPEEGSCRGVRNDLGCEVSRAKGTTGSEPRAGISPRLRVPAPAVGAGLRNAPRGATGGDVSLSASFRTPVESAARRFDGALRLQRTSRARMSRADALMPVLRAVDAVPSIDC